MISKGRRLEALIVAALLVAAAWNYTWTIFPDYRLSLTRSEPDDYYGYLTRGLLKGHLYLDVPADPFLATLKNPWSPAERAGHGMHDASYFRGHYYLYFGVTPVIILFLPFKVLTGRYLAIPAGCLFFSLAGLAANAWTLLAARRRYFEAAAWPCVGFAIACLGLANTIPLLLRRAGIWEAPIAGAYCFGSCGLAFLYRALHSPRRGLWMALASSALGLAVGARPTYLFGCLCLAGPLLHWSRPLGGWAGAWRDRSWRASFFAALLPIAVIGAGLAAYNAGRFGSLAEFGQRYQMSGDDSSAVNFFGWQFPLYGLRVYWLAPAVWSHFFPFLSVAAVPPAPPGALGLEDAYGILPNMPFALFALALPIFLGKKGLPPRPEIAVFCACTAFLTFMTMAVVVCFGGVTNRYMVDFAPGVMLLAALGLLAAASSDRLRRGGMAAAVLAAAGALAAFSVAFNVLAGIRHNRLLRVEYPAVYRRLAHTWNGISWAVDRRLHREYGPIELTIRVKDPEVGKIEPLVVTGHAFLADYLMVQYLPRHTASFGIIHTSYAPAFGPPVALAPGVPHVLRIELGSLYPPPEHPYFDSMDPAEAQRRQSLVKVTLDGKTVLETRLQTYDALSPTPRIGRSGSGLSFASTPFTGEILQSRRLPE